MTIHQLRRMTPGEEAVIAGAERGLAAGDERQNEAIAVLRREGLPHRRVEAWHYTDLRSLLGAPSPSPDAEARGDASLVAPLLSGSIVVDLGQEALLAPGLMAARTSAAPDWRRPVNHLDRDFDTIKLLAVALGADAATFAVAPGAVFDQGIELRHAPGGIGGCSYCVCTIGENARAVVVEQLARGAGRSLSVGVTDLAVGAGAEVLWIIDQGKGAGETHLGQLNVTLAENAVFKLFMLNAGGALVRTEVHAETLGEGAAIQIRGVNLLAAGQHVDVTTTLNHKVANTTSTETFRNVVTGGHGVFQGMIKVSKGAQKTDARMACNTLLLSDDGDFSAKPELEIFADDVQCGHGATAGEIDAGHLFYLMSRGIPEREARALLVKAFVMEVVEELEHETAIEALEARIDAWLAAH